MKDFSKATKRPWVKDKEGNDRIHITKENITYAIATLYADPLDDETEANAELIVTAVNNFDDLSKFLRMVNDCLNDGIPIEKNDPIHNIAKQLLESLK